MLLAHEFFKLGSFPLAGLACVGVIRVIVRSVGFKMHRAVVPVVLWWAAAQAVAWPVCTDLPASAAATLSLDQALARVADCHPEVRAARAALGAAAADVQVAGQAPNPQLTLGAGSIGNAVGAGTLWQKTFDHSARLDQLIERGNKPALRRAAAEAARMAVLADLAESSRRAASSVAHAHQDLWAAQGRLLQLQAAAALNTESLRLLDRRVKAGDAPALDATRFRLDDARLQADLRQTEADSQDLQRQLALLIGAAAVARQLQAQAVDLGSDLAAVLPALMESTQANEAAERRPDVLAALARLRAAEQLRDLAVAGRTRDVNVGVQVDHWPTSPTNTSGTGNTVSLSVTVPLFIHHANEGALARAEADVSIAQDGLRRSRGTAASELARTAAQVRNATERRRLVVEQLEPAAEQVAAGAELAYRRGASSALEVLDARRSLRAVRIERVNADADLAKALADWRVATAPPAQPANN
jgi:cobalt-zinc-cadmium efflux system outer membrane protein